ncbi:MAG: RimK family alpha-L-glutamate ligase [Vampirovibrionales bacterium]
MFPINRGALPPSSQRSGANILLLTEKANKLTFFEEPTKRLGHSLLTIPFRKIRPDNSSLFEALVERLQNTCDVVIGRSKKKSSLKLLGRLEDLGLPSLNPRRSIELAANQLETLKVLDRNGLPIPKTGYITTGVESLGDILVGVNKPSDALDHVGGFPCIVKTLHGSHGNGVHLVKNIAAFRKLTKKLEKQGKPYLIQEFIAGAGGEDLRYFVVCGRVVTAMRRKAKEKDFRANLGQGGSGYPHPIDSVEEALALRASQEMGLGFSGVDLIPKGNGTVSILEVNASPGDKIGTVTGVDVITPIIEAAVRLAEEAKASKVEAPQRELLLLS